MKRLLYILLFFMYSFSSVGITVKAHYCGKRLVKLSIVNGAVDCCCKKKTHTKKSCCNDREQFCKLTDSHLLFTEKGTVKNIQTNNDFLSHGLVSYFSLHSFNSVFKLYKSHFFEKDYIESIPIYLINRVFRL